MTDNIKLYTFLDCPDYTCDYPHAPDKTMKFDDCLHDNIPFIRTRKNGKSTKQMSPGI